jgi:uncharacterized protein YdaU (DUF1376 family)
MSTRKKRSPGAATTRARKNTSADAKKYTAKPARLNVWFPLYPADFAIDTCHLSAEQVGSYLRILCRIWRDGGRVSSEDKHLACIAGVSLRKWRSIKSGISLLFNTSDPAAWSCDWLLVELTKAKTNQENKRRAAQMRWGVGDENPMHMHSSCNADASEKSMHVQCPSPSPSPPYVKKNYRGDGEDGCAAPNLAEAVSRGVVK